MVSKLGSKRKEERTNQSANGQLLLEVRYIFLFGRTFELGPLQNLMKYDNLWDNIAQSFVGLPPLNLAIPDQKLVGKTNRYVVRLILLS